MMPFSKDQRLGQMYQLDESFRELRVMINTYWSKFSKAGLGITHGRLITTIADEGPIKASQLADKLHITCGAVTGLADKLIEQGMLVRKKDESDRRIVLLSLTELGQKNANDINKIRNHLMNHLFANLTIEEMEQGLQLFSKMKNNMISYYENEGD